MKKTTKKLIAFLLTLVMLLSIAPMGAFAAEAQVDYAFDADDLNKLHAFPYFPIDVSGKAVKPLCSFTAPANGTYRILVSAPKPYDESGYSAFIYDENYNKLAQDCYEVTLQAGQTFKFRPQATSVDYEGVYQSTRLKIEEKTCTDADNNNICDFCGSFCSGETVTNNLPTLGEIQLGELVHIGNTIIPQDYSHVYAKFAFTPPADGEYYFSAGAASILLYSNEALTDLINWEDYFIEDWSYVEASQKYILNGNTTYYILVELGAGEHCSSRDLTVVAHESCSDLNHNGICDANQALLGESIIPGEGFDVEMIDYPTTSHAVFTPEEDGVYRFTTPVIEYGSDSIGDIAFSLYEGSNQFANSVPYTMLFNAFVPGTNDYMTDSGGHMITRYFEAGKTYILEMHREDWTENGWSKFYIKLDKLHTCADTDGDGVCDKCDSVMEVELTLWQAVSVAYPEVNVGNPVYLKFTPSGSGTYRLNLDATDGDILAYEVSLYASDKTTQLSFSRDHTGGYCDLEAGQTYYFKTNCILNNGVGYAEYTLTCTHATKTTVPAVTVATCRTPAYNEHKVCTACGEKFGYVETAPQLEHSFTNYTPNNDGTETATCDNGCGETDTRLAFSATYTVSLNLARSIDLNFKVKNANVSDADLASKLQIEVNGANVPFTVKNGEIALNAVARKEAKQIADNINIKVIYDGNLVKEVNYSILEYCKKAITQYPNQAISDLCYALINYGKCQAEYDSIASTAITEGVNLTAMQSLLDKYSFGAENAAPIPPKDIIANNSIITMIKANLSIRSTTDLQFIITTSSEYNEEDVVVVNSYGQQVDPGLVDFIAIYDIDRVVKNYYLILKNLTANTLSNCYTITIDGVDESDFKIEFGPYDYLEELYTSQDTSKSSLANAIYVYGQAANAFQPYNPQG